MIRKSTGMIERIGNEENRFISLPSLEILDRLPWLLTTENRRYFEIGVGVGATVLEVAQALDNTGELHLWSRQQDCDELVTDLSKLGFNNVVGHGNPGHTYSGYHFTLLKDFCAGALPPFDLAYLDGGHVAHLDLGALAILKNVAHKGSIIVLDDFNWTLAKSPTLNPNLSAQTAKDYDTFQIREPHVSLICKALLDTDSRWSLIELKNNSAVYECSA